MPVPNTTGIHGSNRPAPASARAQPCSFATSEGQAGNPAGAKPRGLAASRGGQVPAQLRLPPRSATAHDPSEGNVTYQNRNDAVSPATAGLTFCDFFRERIAQADGAVEHRPFRRRVLVS